MKLKELLLILVVLFVGASESVENSEEGLSIELRNLPSITTDIEPRCSSIECKTSCSGVSCPSGQVCVIIGGKPTCRDRAILIALLCGLKKCGVGLACNVFIAVPSLGLLVAVCINIGLIKGPSCADLICPSGFACTMNQDTGISQCVNRASLQLEVCIGVNCPPDKRSCSIRPELGLIGVFVSFCIGLPTGVVTPPVNCLHMDCGPDFVCVGNDGFPQCISRSVLELFLCAIQSCPPTSACSLQAPLLGIWIAVCIGCVGPNCPNTCQNVQCPPGCVCLLEHGTPTCVKKDELKARLCTEKWCPPHHCCDIEEVSPGVWQAKCISENLPAPTCETLHCQPGQVCCVDNGVATCIIKTNLKLRLCLLKSCSPSHICGIVQVGIGLWVARCQRCIGSHCPNPCSTHVCPPGQVCFARPNGSVFCVDKGKLRRRLCGDFYCPSNTQCDIRPDNHGKWFPVCVPCTTPNCGRPPRCNISCRPSRFCIIINGRATCEKLIDIRKFLCAKIRCRINQRCIVKQRPGPPGYWFAVCVNINVPPPVCNLKCGFGFVCRLKRGPCRRPPCPLVPKCVVDPKYDPCLYRPPCPAGFKCVSARDKNCKPGQLRSFFESTGTDLGFFSDPGRELDPDAVGVMGDMCMVDDVTDVREGQDLGDEEETEGNFEEMGRNQPYGGLLPPPPPQEDTEERGSEDNQCLPVAECQPIPGYDPCLSTTCPKGHYCVTVPDRKCESLCENECSASEESLRDAAEKRMIPVKPKVCPRIAKCISKKKCPPNPCKRHSCKGGFVCKVTEKICEDDDFDCCHHQPVCVKPSKDDSDSSCSDGF